jgi:hypothetical protein
MAYQLYMSTDSDEKLSCETENHKSVYRQLISNAPNEARRKCIGDDGEVLEPCKS